MQHGQKQKQNVQHQKKSKYIFINIEIKNNFYIYYLIYSYLIDILNIINYLYCYVIYLFRRNAAQDKMMERELQWLRSHAKAQQTKK